VDALRRDDGDRFVGGLNTDLSGELSVRLPFFRQDGRVIVLQSRRSAEKLSIDTDSPRSSTVIVLQSPRSAEKRT
jgi:hypothetical protein